MPRRGADSTPIQLRDDSAIVTDAAWFARLTEIAGVVSLTGATLRELFSAPSAWRKEFVVQCWAMAAICTVPVILASGLMQMAFLITDGQLFPIFGIEDRLSGVILTASVRETAPFVVGIVVAGVVGTSICADLGARRVREELDAMSVIGVDPIRFLLAPRLLALVIVTMLLAPIAYVSSNVVSLAVAVSWYEVDVASFFGSIGANFALVELLASLIKCALFGFIIGAIFLHAGMNASGGSEGVGRAVNRGVVTVFLTLFVLNFTYNSLELAMFPELQDLR